MNYLIRKATPEDEPFLWDMLYYAAWIEKDGAVSSDSAKINPDLIKYVKHWGRETDLGYIAHEETGKAIGAAWLRLLIGKDKNNSYIDDYTPELAIAVVPEYIGKGVGTALLSKLLETAPKFFPAVVLSVRETNPAISLYERLGFEVVGEIANRIGTKSFNMVRRFS
jgi:ribosomal protein S18 acetylase RimI-like enzyme